MRKVCVVVINRANYGRVKPVLTAIDNHPELELQLIAGATMLLDEFGCAVDVVEGDGFTVDRKLLFTVSGDRGVALEAQAKTVGLGIVELSTAFSELRPDIVMTVADRFETMATAIAAAYMNIPLAHVQGGEITGNIDETVRHAITKLSHYHFPATDASRERIVKMGEEEWRVVNSGCPSIDTLTNQDLAIDTSDVARWFMKTGRGCPIDPLKPFLLMVQHPVTTETRDGFYQVSQTLEALDEFEMQKIVLWPNIDAGSDRISKAMRMHMDANSQAPYRYFKNFPVEIYNKLLANATCVVGNSSSFIRECSWLGTPSVMIGDRQQGREHGQNALFVDYGKANVVEGIKRQIAHGRYPKSVIFGDGNAGVTIADYLASVELDINKRMTF